jgi:hypothetical protein
MVVTVVRAAKDDAVQRDKITLTLTAALLTVLLLPSQALARVDVAALLVEADANFRRAELYEGDDGLRDVYYRRAEQLAEAVLAEEPDRAEAHFLIFAVRGRRALADGVTISEAWQLRQLNRHLERTLELDPDHASALAAKGGLLLELPAVLGGNPAGSIAYLRRALELNPDGLGTRLTLARALLKGGRGDEAHALLLGTAHRAVLQRDLRALRQVEKLLAASSAVRETAPTETVSVSCTARACGS